MKHTRLLTVILALAIVLAGCLPGLGTMAPLPVEVATPHIAVVTFTPLVNVRDVIIYIGGADLARSEHPAFECEAYRNGQRCFAPGQDDPRTPRLAHPAGESIRIIAYSADASEVTGSAYWSPAD